MYDADENVEVLLALVLGEEAEDADEVGTPATILFKAFFTFSGVATWAEAGVGGRS